MTPKQRNKWKRRLDRASRTMTRGLAVAMKAEFARVAVEAGAGNWSQERHRVRVQAILLRWWLATAQGARVVVDEMLGAERSDVRMRDKASDEDVSKVLAIIAAGAVGNSDVPIVVALLEAQPAVVATVKAAIVASGGDLGVAAVAAAQTPAVSTPLVAAIEHVAPVGPKLISPPSATPRLPAPPPAPPPATLPPGPTPPPETWDELIARQVREQAVRRSRKIAESTQRQVTDLLSKAAKDGLGEEATRKRLAETLPDLSAHRVRTIARTEINAAQNGAAIIAADAKGKPYRREWLAIDDERTRPTHFVADGQEIGAGEKFRVGLSLLDHPGDPNGPPGEVINCRCTMLFLPATS